MVLFPLTQVFRDTNGVDPDVEPPIWLMCMDGPEYDRPSPLCVAHSIKDRMAESVLRGEIPDDALYRWRPEYSAS